MADQNANNETDNFDVVTTEAVDPEPTQEPSQEPKSDDSATAQDDEKGKGQEGQDGSGTEGKDDADDTSADDPGEEAKGPKRSNRFQKKIDRLTRRAKTAEAELARLRAQGKDTSGAEAKAEQAKADAQEAGKEPDPADYESYEDYLDDLADWRNNRKQAKQDKGESDKGDTGNDDSAEDDKADDEQGKDDQPKPDDDPDYIEALEDVQTAFNEYREQYDDFDEVVTAGDLAITPDMVKAMAEGDNPAAVAYHLGKNKKEASRIAGLSAIGQAREIAKLEFQMANRKEPGKKTTEAPDPIQPVKGSDSSQKRPEDMDFNEYERTMNEREQGEGGFW